MLREINSIYLQPNLSAQYAIILVLFVALSIFITMRSHNYGWNQLFSSFFLALSIPYALVYLFLLPIEKITAGGGSLSDYFTMIIFYAPHVYALAGLLVLAAFEFKAERTLLSDFWKSLIAVSLHVLGYLTLTSV